VINKIITNRLPPLIKYFKNRIILTKELLLAGKATKIYKDSANNFQRVYSEIVPINLKIVRLYVYNKLKPFVVFTV